MAFIYNETPRWWAFGGSNFATGINQMDWAEAHLLRQTNYQRGTMAYFLGVPGLREILHIANNTRLSLVMGNNFQSIFNHFTFKSSLCSLYRMALPMFRSNAIYTVGSIRNHMPLIPMPTQMSYMFMQRLDLVKILYNINPPQRNEFRSVFGVILNKAKQQGPFSLYKEYMPSMLRNKSNTLFTLMLYNEMLKRLGWMSSARSKKSNTGKDDDAAKA